MPNNDTLIRVSAKILTITAMLCSCETWPRFVPDKGYAEKAAEWRAKLEETSKSQNPETPKGETPKNQKQTTGTP